MLKEMNIDKLKKHINCMLCCGILRNPLMIVSCKHNFCTSCLLKNLMTQPSCPCCETKDWTFVKNNYLASLIDALFPKAQSFDKIKEVEFYLKTSEKNVIFEETQSFKEKMEKLKESPIEVQLIPFKGASYKIPKLQENIFSFNRNVTLAALKTILAEKLDDIEFSCSQLAILNFRNMVIKNDNLKLAELEQRFGETLVLYYSKNNLS